VVLRLLVLVLEELVVTVARVVALAALLVRWERPVQVAL
jgi:hypothetical protein